VAAGIVAVSVAGTGTGVEAGMNSLQAREKNSQRSYKNSQTTHICSPCIRKQFCLSNSVNQEFAVVVR
jgi:hypothetical protein